MSRNSGEGRTASQSKLIALSLRRSRSPDGLYFSTSTPRQKATYPLILRAAGFGSG